MISNTPFKLTSSGQNQKLSLLAEVENFLHKELSYIKKEARFYRGKFNFAYLSEKIFGRFGHSIHRNTIRRFAIKEGYYEQTPKEKKNVNGKVKYPKMAKCQQACKNDPLSALKNDPPGRGIK